MSADALPGAGPGAGPGADAALAAALFAVDPGGIGGVVVRAAPGPARDRWLALLRESLPPQVPLRRIPLHVTDGRLLGGLDLAATLRARRPVAERGILAAADGGVVLLAMAERLESNAAARIACVLDAKEVVLQRDGLTLRTPTHVGVVALDEGIGADEHVPGALADRLAFHIDFAGLRASDLHCGGSDADAIATARAMLPRVQASDAIVEALCAAAQALGIASLRAPLLALQAARASAALCGRACVDASDASVAARLVLAPRATTMPEAGAPPDGDDAETPPDAPPDNPAAEPEPTPAAGREPGAADAGDDATAPAERLDDVVRAAAQAAIPAGLLAQLKLADAGAPRSRVAGRAGSLHHTALRGAPAGIRRGAPRAGARLNVAETLRAAAPWQRLRGRDPLHASGGRVEVRAEDFHVSRFLERSETTTIFVVDASGSSALHRLAETKGAVELLLADCYVRRDRVAVVAFRGVAAEVLLPPTRSLVRAKRALASLAGGGGTPLAAGIDAAALLAAGVRRRGGTPVVVLLTDGRANIARDGESGRMRAGDDAMAAARALRTAHVTVLLVDTSPRAQASAGQLAGAMGARYLALPHADATLLSRAVRAGA